MISSTNQHYQSSNLSSANNNKSSTIIQRIGGERDFQFVILSLIDRLQDDRQLARFFSTFEPNNLAAHQEEFLRAVFAAQQQSSNHSMLAVDDNNARTSTTTTSTSKNKKKNDLSGFIRLRYFRLFQQGFDETHFDLTVTHIVEALEDAWVNDQEVIADIVRALTLVRPIFEERNGQQGATRGTTTTTTTTTTTSTIVVPSSAYR